MDVVVDEDEVQDKKETEAAEKDAMEEEGESDKDSEDEREEAEREMAKEAAEEDQIFSTLKEKAEAIARMHDKCQVR